MALADQKLHADDKPVPVLNWGRGKAETPYLWLYVQAERTTAGGACQGSCRLSLQPLAVYRCTLAGKRHSKLLFNGKPRGKRGLSLRFRSAVGEKGTAANTVIFDDRSVRFPGTPRDGAAQAGCVQRTLQFQAK